MFAEVKWQIALHLCFKSMSRAQERLFFFCRPCDREKTYPHYRERVSRWLEQSRAKTIASR
jgi:hypothetical protein